MLKLNLTITSFLMLTIFTACKKDRTISGFDSELFAKAQKTDGFRYYNDSEEFLTSPKAAGHKSLYLRTKYNDIASEMLDLKGMVIQGANFPDGSLIVNEMSSTKGIVDKIAIMFKDPKNQYADKNGWVWSYMNKDNTIIESANRMGVSCLSCHTSGNGTLMSNYFLQAK